MSALEIHRLKSSADLTRTIIDSLGCDHGWIVKKKLLTKLLIFSYPYGHVGQSTADKHRYVKMICFVAYLLRVLNSTLSIIFVSVLICFTLIAPSTAHGA